MMFSYNYGLLLVFFFKQKTAYEMRISDWSSDVCSSDLGAGGRPLSAPPAQYVDRAIGPHVLGVGVGVGHLLAARRGRGVRDGGLVLVRGVRRHVRIGFQPDRDLGRDQPRQRVLERRVAEWRHRKSVV